ncbi:CatB-related O-acetyltransferase [Escherichia coli]|uniref:CatB-related O-acetyltransferase n=1 Tax=Gammaproteobacteria TaxID=1236 RepID=UPI0022835B72|nr:CatB-related O-acetyltransferase [Escherichia coli]MCZ0545401.1 CatB-related O-acetyltransferase [Escherichia coli]
MKKLIKSIMPRWILVAIKRAYYKRYFAQRGLKTNFPEIIDPTIKTEPGVLFLGEVSVGHHVEIGKNTYITEGRISPNVKIGRYCSIARNTNIAGTEHPIDWLTSSPVAYDTEYFPSMRNSRKCVVNDGKTTVIGHDVWLGASVIVKRGVKIGDGAIIGAGSVVTKDIPPYAIAAGVPAKVLRYRFSPEVIAKLMELKWWEFEETELMNVQWDDINQALADLMQNRPAIRPN